jgi:methionyl-tRNA formyltransferase
MGDTKLKIAILTGDELRHRYYANALTHEFEAVLVAHEKKANVHEKTDFGETGNDIIAQHFYKRAANEAKYFANPPASKALKTVSLLTGEVNENAFVKELLDANPDYVLLFGSSLIGDDILQAFPNKVINLHLGLSPYYRGSGTLFWPLVDGKPECVGSTIHLAVKKIDAGGILGQVRPEIDPQDGPHDLGNKTILASLAAIKSMVIGYDNGEIVPEMVDMSEGKLCLRKHLTVEAIEVLYANLENNMLREYLNLKEERDSAFPIIDVND